MGRGMGTTQRAMVDHLNTLSPPWATVADLAGALGRSPRQVLATVRSLEARGSVRTERVELRYEMTGQLRPGRRYNRGKMPDGASVMVKEGEPWPYKPGYVATGDTTFYPTARTVHGLQVWSVDRVKWWAALTTEERKRELNLT